MPQEIAASILIVDDQPDLVDSLSLTLAAIGYQVVAASDGLEALAVLQAQPIDLILADISMPRLNGYQLYERVRGNPDWTPIPFIFLTARALDSDVRYGKELGVDDYLTKPIQPEDLLAVVQGKLRRAQQLSQRARSATPLVQSAPPAMPKAAPLLVGRLEIDPGQHQVRLSGQPIKLSAREFVLLEYLARRVNQVLPPQELIKVTHGLETDAVEAGTLLRPLIRTLRRKLGYPVGETGCLENIRGVGYRLIPPDDV